jgi:hypothetical protein
VVHGPLDKKQQRNLQHSSRLTGLIAATIVQVSHPLAGGAAAAASAAAAPAAAPTCGSCSACAHSCTQPVLGRLPAEPATAWPPALLAAAASSCRASSALRCRCCSMLPEVISTSTATQVACSSRRHCTRLLLGAKVPAVTPPPLPLPVPPKPGPLALALPGPSGARAAALSEVLPAGGLRSLSSLSITPMSRSGSSCSQRGRQEAERSTEKRQVATACHFEWREVKDSSLYSC